MKSGEYALTKAEWEKIKAVIDSLEDELLIKMAVSTGIRREDIVSISINNIDFDESYLTFHESKKNKNRTIFLSPEIMQLIRKYIKTIPKRDLLFDFTGRTAWNKLDRLCRRAGIPSRPFHALRATCIKFCDFAGWREEETAKLTGDSIRVIQEHYRTPSDSEMKEIAKSKITI